MSGSFAHLEGDLLLADGGSADLFAIADAICEMLDAPVTIEDRCSRVLAFSIRQDEADAARIATVLGRQVPEQHRRMLEELGVFRRLYHSREPIYEQLDGELLPRAAVAVRADEEILGSIWAVVRAPLSAERRRAFGETAKLVALRMLRQKESADLERRLRADLLAALLEGGLEAAAVAGRLGLPTNHLCVLAAQPCTDQASTAGEAAFLEAQRQRLCDSLAVHVGAIHPSSATALIGNVVYSVLPLHADGEQAEMRAQQIAETFLTQRASRHLVNVGVGRVATMLNQLRQSRTDADRALRVLRARGVGGVAAGFAAVQFDSLLLQLNDIVTADGQPPTGAYQRLATYDAEHSSGLLDTLSAYLDSLGDVNAAASAIHVHPNTFRYRLRRLLEISGLDLSNPDAVLATMLQLRLFHRRNPSAQRIRQRGLDPQAILGHTQPAPC